MDPKLARVLDLDVPKINPLIGHGVATTHLKYAEKYIDDVFRSASKGFPPGLVYIGCERCTPREEFDLISRKKGVRRPDDLDSMSRKKGSKRTIDVARSNLYMMRYRFKFNGVEIEPRYMFLPYVDDGGFIYLGGSRFNITPILSDRVISVGVSDIFVRLLRDRLTFKRSVHSFMMDGKREIIQVVHSEIYHKSARLKKLKPTVKANHTLMHYLLCKYGFTDTFLKFGNCSPVIGGYEINTNSYPEDEWVICSSNQIKPKGFGRGFYVASQLRVAIKREQMTPMVKNMIGGLFYIVDHFPQRIQPSLEYLDSKRLWMVLLGHIIFSGAIGEGKLYADINDHIMSLDEYVDNLIIYKLKDIGVDVSDIYQLFAIIIEHYNDWFLSAAEHVASMYNKELSVVYYVLYGITSAIFKLYFKLKAASKKELTAKEIVSNMNVTLRTGLIFSIIKGHGEVSTISSSGDNKAFKITSLLVSQDDSVRTSSKKKRTNINDPAKRLHVSVAEVGNSHAITKGDPSGRSKLNNCIQIGHDGVVVRNPKFIKLLDDIQNTISEKYRYLKDTNMVTSEERGEDDDVEEID